MNNINSQQLYFWRSVISPIGNQNITINYNPLPQLTRSLIGTLPPLPKVGDIQLFYSLYADGKNFDGIHLPTKKHLSIKLITLSEHANKLKVSQKLLTQLETREDKELINLLIPPEVEYRIIRDNTNIKCYWIEPMTYKYTLHEHLLNYKKFTESTVKNYFIQICKIVKFCHNRGVILRDIKLINFVFIDKEHKVLKLIDIDKCLTCTKEDNDNISHRCGCPTYFAPELFNSNELFYSGKAADIWSLGILLYILITGRYPFFHNEPSELIEIIRHSTVVFTVEDKIDLSGGYLIRSMLNKDPTRRPNIEEVICHPYLNDYDYKSDFIKKPFNSTESIFWV